MLDIEATDLLRERSCEYSLLSERGEHPYLQYIWRGNELKELEQVLEYLRLIMPSMTMYLFVHNHCGAVQTTSEEVLSKALPLVAWFETWSAVSEHGAHGIMLDMDVDDDPGKGVLGTSSYDEYTLMAKGDRFVRALTLMFGVMPPP